MTKWFYILIKGNPLLRQILLPKCDGKGRTTKKNKQHFLLEMSKMRTL